MPYLNIGPCPAEETPVQFGDDNYRQLAEAEGRRFITLIRDTMGPEPFGASLGLKWFPHDFGSYMEVVCRYDEAYPESEEYAFRCESDEVPSEWDTPEPLEK